MESLAIFGWAIAVGALVAISLSVYGVLLATRDSSLQSMAISQGAQLGVLVTLGFIHFDNKLLPFFGGLFVAWLVFETSNRVTKKVRASKNTVFIVFFLALLAGSYCLISIFPMLDSHHSQAFFGDLVYLSGQEMVVAAIVSFLSLIIFLINFKNWCRSSFVTSTFGKDGLFASKREKLFLGFSLLLVVASVFSVGLLLTLSALFVPTMVLSFVKVANLKRHFVACALIAGAGVVLGFGLTLKLGDYPTVPVIVLVFLVLSLIILGLFNWRVRVNR